MLAIGRALLSDPALLVMDEPTEGLAPVIVGQVRDMLVDLAAEGGMSILVIEQNIGVATSVSDRVAIMVNGRIERVMDAAALRADRALQQRLLGVGRAEDEAAPAPAAEARARADVARVYRVDRGGGGGGSGAIPGAFRTAPQAPNRWGLSAAALGAGAPAPAAEAPDEDAPGLAALPLPAAERWGRTVLVAGTFDTKGAELRFLADRVRATGLPVRTVDLSTSGRPARADVPAAQVAAMHPRGASAVMTGDRGASVAAMALAFERWIAREAGIGGIVSAGGSGGTALATPAMRALPVGIPKVMVSTVASGDVGAYVGGSDVTMMHAVADVQGLNAITEAVLSNAAHAVAGMVARMPSAQAREARRRAARPAVGLSMFGVTTPAVQAVARALEPDADALVFHATGTGGRAMEALVDAGMLGALIDLTTTEVADMLVGGVFAATPDRLGAVIRTGIPWVGAFGACDMVNFGPRETVPPRFASRRFVVHNPQVTLMRTTRDECRAIGAWIAGRLNEAPGPVRLLLPEGGVSALDAPGQPFEDAEARAALFEGAERALRPTPRRGIERVPAHINDPAFAEAAIAAHRALAPPARSPARRIA